MKYVIILILAVVLAACGECDNSNYYQIKVITPRGNTLISDYQANGLGPCTSWQKTEVVTFSDSTSRFKLSQVIDRATILAYQSKSTSH